MPAPSAFLAAPACAYLVSGALYIWRLLRRDQRAGTAGLAIGIIGAAIHGVLLLIRVVDDPQAIGATVADAASLVGFLTAAVFLAAQCPFGIAAIGSAIMPMCFGVTLVAAVFPSAGDEVPDILRSPWFFAHVPPALLAYVAFAFSFAAAAMYLGEARLLRSKRIAAVIGVMPSLDQLESAMYRTATFGFLLFTIGIATGAFWAQDVWARYWAWTPKQAASLVTWLVFATYLHYRLIRGSRGRNGAWLVVGGFASIILTFLAAGALEDDPHRFF